MGCIGRFSHIEPAGNTPYTSSKYAWMLQLVSEFKIVILLVLQQKGMRILIKIPQIFAFHKHPRSSFPLKVFLHLSISQLRETVLPVWHTSRPCLLGRASSPFLQTRTLHSSGLLVLFMQSLHTLTLKHCLLPSILSLSPSHWFLPHGSCNRFLA